MIDRELVDRLRTKRKISKTEFPKLIGMSNTGYNQMWDNNSMKVETLNKIAQVLQVPVTYFFDQQSGMTHEDEPGYDKGAQAKLIACMEKKEQLYERLLKAEAELARAIRRDNDEEPGTAV